MTMTSYDNHFSMLFLHAKQALSIVIELNTPFCNILCHPITFFIFRAIKHFVRVKFCSQTNKFNNLLPTQSPLNIPRNLLLSLVLIPDG